MRHQFAGLFGRCVQADRVVDVVVHAEGHVGVGAVDAGTAGVDQVLDAGVAAAFEDVDEAHQVAVDIGMRVLQRIAYAGLGGGVEHPLKTVIFE